MTTSKNPQMFLINSIICKNLFKHYRIPYLMYYKPKEDLIIYNTAEFLQVAKQTFQILHEANYKICTFDTVQLFSYVNHFHIYIKSPCAKCGAYVGVSKDSQIKPDFTRMFSEDNQHATFQLSTHFYTRIL